jgi:DNA-binding NarL/FixJ family response regulator
MSNERFTIALLHDEALLLQGLARLLGELPGYRLVAQVSDHSAFKRAFALGAPPQLLHISLHSACKDQCTLLGWMAQHMPHCRILVVGQQPPTEVLLHLLCAGAHGFLGTDRPAEELGRMLHHLVNGAIHFPAEVMPQLSRLLPQLERPACPVPDKKISPCQREFLRWLCAADDHTYVDIAKKMGKTLRCVLRYRDKLFKRFKVNTKAALVRLAQKMGLDQDEPLPKKRKR